MAHCPNTRLLHAQSGIRNDATLVAIKLCKVLFVYTTDKKKNMQLKPVFPTIICAVLLCFTSCAQKSDSKAKTNSKKPIMSENAKLDTITLGGGCFWCVEAIYQRLNGVVSVTSGYAGGKIKNPAYREVCIEPDLVVDQQPFFV